MFAKNPLHQAARFFSMQMPFENKPDWVKSRGYLHITPKLDLFHRYQEILSKVQNEKFVAKHAFYPLLHAVIKERKYKKLPSGSTQRAHSHKNEESNKVESFAKLRPLHYATHIDSLIFGYYAELILERYRVELENYPLVKESVIAYRKIPLDTDIDHGDKGKSTIHFAYEAFQEIRKRASNDDCIVLMFDIKSFFSEIDHTKLKTAWGQLFGFSRLPSSHHNVFKATTDFRYILLDDLRVPHKIGNRRNGFDEKKLASIRKNLGIEAFFESNEDFRNAILNKRITVYKHPFVKNKIPIGIPQGLPISAVLANLYLLDFDKRITNEIVEPYQVYYRRYSDDILIACSPKDSIFIEEFIKKSIRESKLEISETKTERYLFTKSKLPGKNPQIECYRITNESSFIKKPLTYLGFEFYGEKILIKSTNLAKFYRRMIYTVKRKAKRAVKISELDSLKPVIFKGRIKRKFTHINLNNERKAVKPKRLTKNDDGYFSYKPIKATKKKHNTNYLSYINRASEIMNEPAIKMQLKKRRQIFNSAILRHLKR